LTPQPNVKQLRRVVVWPGKVQRLLQITQRAATRTMAVRFTSTSMQLGVRGRVQHPFAEWAPLARTIDLTAFTYCKRGTVTRLSSHDMLNMLPSARGVAGHALLQLPLPHSRQQTPLSSIRSPPLLFQPRQPQPVHQPLLRNLSSGHLVAAICTSKQLLSATRPQADLACQTRLQAMIGNPECHTTPRDATLRVDSSSSTLLTATRDSAQIVISASVEQRLLQHHSRRSHRQM